MGIYLSAVGIIMGLSVIETVSAQFVNESFSKCVAVSMDSAARWCFPLVFLCVILLMFGPMDLDLMLVLVHAVLAIFASLYFSYVSREAVQFPRLFFQRALRSNLSAS